MSESSRIYVTKEEKISVFENNLVTLTLKDGSVIEPLEPRRLFPVSNPDHYISLLDSDGVEIAIIRSLLDIDDDSRQCIKNSLDDYYLVPNIIKIISSEEKYGTLRWIVETDRGTKAFDIRNVNHDIKVYKDGKIRIRDADDNRYVIPDYTTMDAYSKAQLISYI